MKEADTFVNQEICLEFKSLKEWKNFLDSNPDIQARSKIDGIIQSVRSSGLYYDLEDRIVAPGEVDIHGTNYQETVTYNGLSARARAVIWAFCSSCPWWDGENLKIFMPEAFSPLARLLRRNYLRFLGAECLGPEHTARIFPFRNEDLANLSFPDESFDVAIVTEKFEQVADLNPVFLELRRILRPGGTLLGSFPFAFMEEAPVVRAMAENLAAVAGDSRESVSGSQRNSKNSPAKISVSVPGWAVLDDVKKAGFSNVHMLFLSSYSRGITSKDISGILLLRAVV